MACEKTNFEFLSHIITLWSYIFYKNKFEVRINNSLIIHILHKTILQKIIQYLMTEIKFGFFNNFIFIIIDA